MISSNPFDLYRMLANERIAGTNRQFAAAFGLLGLLLVVGAVNFASWVCLLVVKWIGIILVGTMAVIAVAFVVLEWLMDNAGDGSAYPVPALNPCMYRYDQYGASCDCQHGETRRPDEAARRNAVDRDLPIWPLAVLALSIPGYAEMARHIPHYIWHIAGWAVLGVGVVVAVALAATLIASLFFDEMEPLSSHVVVAPCDRDGVPQWRDDLMYAAGRMGNEKSCANRGQTVSEERLRTTPAWRGEGEI